MAKEVMNFDQLFAGEVPYIVKVAVSAGKINRGDVLECVVTSGVPATTYAKATADAKTTNTYVIAAETVDAESNDVVVAYKEGYFNADKVHINDAEVSDASKRALSALNIFLLNAQSGKVE